MEEYFSVMLTQNHESYRGFWELSTSHWVYKNWRVEKYKVFSKRQIKVEDKWNTEV